MSFPLRSLLLLCLLSCMAAFHAVGQEDQMRYSLSGRILTDKDVPLWGAAVEVLPEGSRQGRQGVASDSTGRYHITLPGGEYLITVSFLGLETTMQKIALAADTTLDFVLAPHETTFDDIIISARRGRLHSMETGVENLSPELIRTMPALLGEVDVIKSIQLLPGVQATSEGGSGFSVRGGSHDQNLILLDDATLYNASHLMGFFSVFNNDVVEDVTLYKGDVPASFGGRLSSLLDVRTREAGRERFSGTGGIGLISSRLALETPLGQKAGLMVSGRRTYADMFLKLAPNRDLRKSKLYFYDSNLKLAWEAGPRDRVQLSGYLGSDKMGTTFAGVDFGNKALSLKWTHAFSPSVLSTVTLTGSGYDYKVTAKIGDEIDQYWKSSMTDWGARIENIFLVGQNHTLRVGWNMIYHNFSPGDMVSRREDPMLAEIRLPRRGSLENAVYVTAESQLWWGVRMKYGLRASLFANMSDGRQEKKGLYGQTHNLEPRVGIVKSIGENSTVKASYSRMAQYIHIASNSAAGSPLDVWFQSSPLIKPQLSDQYSAGYFHRWGSGGWELSFEMYYRKLRNTIDFRDHAKLILNEDLEQEILVGKGYAYGAELMLRRKTDKLDGWVSYAYGRSKRKTEGINDGLWYRSQFDRPHNLNIVGAWSLNEKWTVSASWIYSTGTPVSFPSGRFLVEREYVPVYEGRNRHRYPDYHRLDLAATMQMATRRKRYRSELSFSLYNAYGRKNPWMITFEADENSPTSFYAEQIYLFSVVPSVTWNFYF